jgi:hypothetical protein
MKGSVGPCSEGIMIRVCDEIKVDVSLKLLR